MSWLSSSTGAKPRSTSGSAAWASPRTATGAGRPSSPPSPGPGCAACSPPDGAASQPAAADPNVITIDNVAPRLAVSTGGGGRAPRRRGTTAAGLRAGRPTLICPFLGDQPFWGHQIDQLGAGPKPLPQRQLNADRLTQRIRALITNPGYADRSADIAQRLRSEDGVGRAIESARVHTRWRSHPAQAGQLTATHTQSPVPAADDRAGPAPTGRIRRCVRGAQSCRSTRCVTMRRAAGPQDRRYCWPLTQT